MENKTCGDCKYFNPKRTFDYPTVRNVRECTGGFYRGSFVDPDAPCCPDFKPKPTLFDRITASPEVLAPKFVYYTVNQDQFGTYYWYCSALIPGEKWSEESEAIAATVAKLKEVAN